MPKAPKLDKNDPEYLEKRRRNNEAIKKSREKAREKANKTEERIEELKRDNKETEEKIERLGSEMNFLKDILLGEILSVLSFTSKLWLFSAHNNASSKQGNIAASTVAGEPSIKHEEDDVKKLLEDIESLNDGGGPSSSKWNE